MPNSTDGQKQAAQAREQDSGRVPTPAPTADATAEASSGKQPSTQPVRAINEDDDGYDPYSDLHDRPVPDPLFERDPWA